ncbi:prepilin peptidase [Nocardia sp. NBC_00511]|uniref:prepilin peptidase n=1 Tax=Nocardia sp. NBC_00511 TaxID=2903591 RepID=UPI0030E062AE
MPLLPTLLLTAWCAALSWFDLRERRLPNALTLTGAVAVLIYAISRDESATAVTGGLLLAAPYLTVHLGNPNALGAGDVKLALGLGASTALAGPEAWTTAALTAPLLTATAGLGTVLARVTPGRKTLPHGPAMCVASLVALLATR